MSPARSTLSARFFLVVAVAGCSSGSKSAGSGSDDAASGDGACTVLQVAVATDTCREDWACPTEGELSFVCGPLDGGRACACVSGESSDAMSAFDGDPCAAEGGPAKAAQTVCGWMVP